MALAELQVRREGNTVIATINRPEKHNALHKHVYDELKSLLDVLETDRTVRAMIITGVGDKAFCVGADLKERASMNEKDVLNRLQAVRHLYLRLERLGFPVIAAINGMALGGGLELALACDLRVASENAVLGFPEVELGIIPGNGGTQRLARLVGRGRAMELILLSRRLSAQEALEFEVIHSVVPGGQALAQAKQWAAKIGEAGPIAVRQAKNAIRMGLEKSLEEGLALEIEAYAPCLHSKDRQEGLKAFQEKRKPVFIGE